MKLSEVLPERPGGYVIVGMAKCGQNSLLAWLQKRYQKCYKHEVLQLKEKGVEEIKRKFQFQTPIILIRDKAERAWSSFLYARMNGRMSFPEYLDVKSFEFTHIVNPIELAHYENYIKLIEDLKPIVLKYEDVITDPELPLVNTTSNKIGKEKPSMPEEYRKLFWEKYNEP